MTRRALRWRTTCHRRLAEKYRIVAERKNWVSKWSAGKRISPPGGLRLPNAGDELLDGRKFAMEEFRSSCRQTTPVA